MEIKQFYKNLGFLFFFNLTIKPIWVFGIERKFQLLLGQESYGLYFSHLSWIYIISVILDLGLHSYSVKAISEEIAKGKTNIGGYIYAKSILICVYIIAVIGSILFLKLDKTSIVIFVLIAAMQLLFSVYQYFRNIIQGLQHFKQDSWLSSLDRVFLILIGGLMLAFYLSEVNLLNFITIHILAYGLSIAVIVYFIFRYHDQWYYSNKDINLKHIITDAMPLVIIQILMTIYTRIDAVMLKYLYPDGLKECGDLAYSFRFVDSAYNALYLIGVFLLPTVSNNFVSKNYDYIRKLTYSLFGLALLISIAYAILCYVFSNDIYHYFYHTDNLETIRILQIQVWSVVGVALMYVSGSYLTGIGAFNSLIAILTFCMLLALSMNYILIPQNGALGAAMTSTVVQCSVGVLQSIVAIYFLSKYKSKTL